MRPPRPAHRAAVGKRGLQTWLSRWPCHGLTGLTWVRFTYDRDGSLVDVETRPVRDPETGEAFDGPALAALSRDCQDTRKLWRIQRCLPIE